MAQTSSGAGETELKYWFGEIRKLNKHFGAQLEHSGAGYRLKIFCAYALDNVVNYVVEFHREAACKLLAIALPLLLWAVVGVYCAYHTEIVKWIIQVWANYTWVKNSPHKCTHRLVPNGCEWMLAKPQFFNHFSNNS